MQDTSIYELQFLPRTRNVHFPSKVKIDIFSKSYSNFHINSREDVARIKTGYVYHARGTLKF